MGRTIKFILMLLIMVSILFSMSGCSRGPESASELIELALKNESNFNFKSTAQLDLNFTTTFTSEGNSETLSGVSVIKADIEASNKENIYALIDIDESFEPLVFSANSKAQHFNKAKNIYAVLSGDAFVIHTKEENMPWSTQTVSVQNKSVLDSIKESLSTAQFSSDDNGYYLSVKLSDIIKNEVLCSAFLLNKENSESLQNLVKETEQARVVLAFNTDCLLYKIQIDEVTVSVNPISINKSVFSGTSFYPIDSITSEECRVSFSMSFSDHGDIGEDSIKLPQELIGAEGNENLFDFVRENTKDLRKDEASTQEQAISQNEPQDKPDDSKDTDLDKPAENEQPNQDTDNNNSNNARDDSESDSLETSNSN